MCIYMYIYGLPRWLSRKESAWNERDMGLISGSEGSPGGRHGSPLWYSCLENPMESSLVGWSPIGLQRVGFDWSDWAHTDTHVYTHTHTHTHTHVLIYIIFQILFPYQFSSVQSLSHVQLFVTPWTAARQGSLSITNSQSSPKSMSIESVMPSYHLILCYPFLLLLSIFPSIRVFSTESTLRIRWPKCWSFSFKISSAKEHPGLIFRMDWLDLLAVQGTLKSLLKHHSSKAEFFSTQLSSQSNSHIHTWPLEKP